MRNAAVFVLGGALLATACGDNGQAPTTPVTSTASVAAVGVTVPEPGGLDRVAETAVVDAVRGARAAVLAKPDSAAAWGQLGHVLAAHGWPEAAAEAYRGAVERDAKTVRWHYYLGHALHTLEPQAAATALQRFIAAQTGYAPAHLYLGYALRSLGRAAEALTQFERALALDARMFPAEQALGELDLAAGRVGAARQRFERVLAAGAAQRETHANLARIYMQQGDGERARVHAEASRVPVAAPVINDPLWGAIQDAGASLDWHGVRGAIFLEQGNLERALEELRVAVDGGIDNPRVFLNWGLALMHSRRLVESRAALERAHALVLAGKAVDLERDVPVKILVNLGIAAARSGDLAAGNTHLEAALALDANSAAALTNLAVLRNHQGQRDEAIDLLFRAVAVAPSAKRIARLAALLRQAGRAGEAAAVEARAR